VTYDDEFWEQFIRPGWAKAFVGGFMRFREDKRPDGMVLRPYQAELLERIKYENVRQLVAVLKGRQMGFTYTLAMLGIAWGFCHANHNINIVSLKKGQAMLTIDYAKELLLRNKDVLWKHCCPPHAERRPSNSQIFFSSGSRMTARPLRLPRADNIRGIASDVTMVDEAAFMPDPAFDAIIPTIDAKRGLLLMITTAGYSRTSYFYRIYIDPESGYEKLKYPSTLLYTEEELEQKRREMRGKPGAFEREHLCKWQVDFENLFPEEVFKPCFLPNIRESESTDICFAGLDIGVSANPSVYCVVKPLPNNQFALVHLKIFPRGTLLSEVCGYAIDYAARYSVFRTCVDARGAGAGVYQDLRGRIMTEGVKWTAQDKTVDMFNLRKLLAERRLLIDKKEVALEREFRGYNYKYLKSGNAAFSCLESDDIIDALALAIRATRLKEWRWE